MKWKNKIVTRRKRYKEDEQKGERSSGGEQSKRTAYYLKKSVMMKGEKHFIKFRVAKRRKRLMLPFSL